MRRKKNIFSMIYTKEFVGDIIIGKPQFSKY
jgi:hypothetical protein